MYSFSADTAVSRRHRSNSWKSTAQPPVCVFSSAGPLLPGVTPQDNRVCLLGTEDETK